MHRLLIISLIFISSTSAIMANILPDGFVYLHDIDNTILTDIRYAGPNNFLGRAVAGYLAPKCIITESAAIRLMRIQAELKSKGLGLKVFDCYRPQMAVDEFIDWSQDASDQKMKLEYYPRINKADFFRLGYVAARSGHTRGSTVDLTLVRYNSSHTVELDMGTHFDFMDELSHPLNPNIIGEAYNNRMLLRNIMQKYGFIPLATEWWHFTLADEPFKESYFNFPVK